MPITGQGTTPGGIIGPGLALIMHATGESSGPGWSWLVVVGLSTAPTTVGWEEQFSWTSNDQQLQLGTQTLENLSGPSTVQFTTDTAVHLTIYLQDTSGSSVTNTALALTWDATTGLGRQAVALAGQNQGLTTDQADQLQNASDTGSAMADNWATYQSVTLPSLQDVLNGITSGITTTVQSAAGLVSQTIGSLFSGKIWDVFDWTNITDGPTCTDVDVDLSGLTCWGIVVDITTWPEWIVWTGPASDYSAQGLAVLNVSREGHGVIRKGIHSLNEGIIPLPGFSPAFSIVNVPQTPADYHVTIKWASGVCGQLWGLRLP